MSKTLPNIEYTTEGKISVVDSLSALYKLPFEKSDEYYSNLESKVRFLKGCEKLVRGSDRYKKYIFLLKKKCKLNKCQVLSKLTDNDCTIEMHHGPIFTLYDYAEIISDYHIKKGDVITTFDVADELLDLHWEHKIQVVMLSSTMHEEAHKRDIFINTNQAWGDLHGFLELYPLESDLKEKYNRYVDRSSMLDSTTRDILRLNDDLIANL